MARRFLDNVRTDLTAALATVQATIFTNAAQAISGDDVQNAFNIFEPLWQDMFDSGVQDEAGLGGSTSMTFTADVAWTPINDLTAPPVIAYDDVQGGDADFLKVDQADGSITTTATPGFSYESLGAVSIDAGNGIVVEAAILRDGIPTVLVGSIVGTGGVRSQSIYVTSYLTSHTPNQKYQLGVRAPAGPTSVTLTPRNFGLIIVPTNNP